MLRLVLIAALLSLPACQSPLPWRDLFDGSSLAGWSVPQLGGEGDVEVRDGALVLGEGWPLTAVAWQGAPLPTVDYEVHLRAARQSGDDFFAAVTFPVGEAACSLVLGGWGGEVVGLSCVDGYDANHNVTKRVMQFEDGRDYDVRIHVTAAAVVAWLDDVEIVRQAVPGHEFNVRGEVVVCEPFGLAAYQTVGAFKLIRIRKLR